MDDKRKARATEEGDDDSHPSHKVVRGGYSGGGATACEQGFKQTEVLTMCQIILDIWHSANRIPEHVEDVRNRNTCGMSMCWVSE